MSFWAQVVRLGQDCGFSLYDYWVGFLKSSILVVAGSIVSSAFAQGFASHVVHAPSDVSIVEFQRLLDFGKESFPRLSESIPTIENESGDLAIRVKNLGWLVVSKDSELMAPIRLHREVFALSKKYKPTELIPFTELSPSALKQFQRGILGQYPRYDIGRDSCFTIRTQYGLELRSSQFNFGKSSSPSAFGADKEKRKEFNSSVEKHGLILVRSEQEASEYAKSKGLAKDGVFYDQAELLSRKVDLDRKGLAEFQAWADFTLHQTDDQIFSRYASDPQWTSMLKTRTVKSTEDYKNIAPDEYREFVDEMKLNYKIHQFKSPDDVEPALANLPIGFHFSFSVSCGLQGSNQLFHLLNRW